MLVPFCSLWGYDPRVSITHNPVRRGEPRWSSTLWDRAGRIVDAAVLAFVLRETFSPADFDQVGWHVEAGAAVGEEGVPNYFGGCAASPSIGR